MTATPNYGSKVDTLNSLFKTVYADSLANLVPDDTKLQKLIPFDAATKLGRLYEQAVNLSFSGGFTFAGTDDMYKLNDAQMASLKTAQVSANEMLLRDQVSYKAISASAGSEQAFFAATKHGVKNMNLAFARNLEVQLMYGSANIGTVASISGSVITLTAATWADGIWIGSEGSRLIQVYDTTGATLRVPGSGGTTLASDGTTAVRVTAIDPVNHAITVDAAPASVVATDVIYLAGSKGREMLGLHAILTASGTLFNIATSSSTLWKANSVAVGGALTVSAVINGLAPLVGKGLAGDNIKLICGVHSFNDVTKDIFDKRQIDSSYSEAELKTGTQGIRIFCQNGTVEVVPSVYCKEGFAYAILVDSFSRIGSTDKTFSMPGEDNQFFKPVPNSAAWEMRIYTDQALFCREPGKQCVFTGIVPTA